MRLGEIRKNQKILMGFYVAAKSKLLYGLGQNNSLKDR